MCQRGIWQYHLNKSLRPGVNDGMISVAVAYRADAEQTVQAGQFPPLRHDPPRLPSRLPSQTHLRGVE